jgi:hypothetical protein
VLSLGAGVQSSTLLLMACEGIVAIDRAIFADTGWEPKAVYDWLGFLRVMGERAGIPIDTVSNGNIRENALNGSFVHMPLYIEMPDGKRLMGQRQCTNQYKIRPIRQRLRELNGGRTTPKVDLLVGISLDEYQRAKPANVQWIEHQWPLIDRRMTRADCVAWLQRHGYAEPPKSSCIGCPFRTPKQWRALTGDEMADAVDFDRAIRDGARGTQYLWRGFVPLEMADFRTKQEKTGQIGLFDAIDASDGCGVLCPADDEDLDAGVAA